MHLKSRLWRHCTGDSPDLAVENEDVGRGNGVLVGISYI